MRAWSRLPNRELILFFLATIAVFSFLSPSFRTVGNVENILVGFSHMGILAIGQAFPILLGGIDLSVGSIISLSGMIAFDCFVIYGMRGAVVLPLMLLAATAAGLINGILIVKARLQPFIATLATMAAYRGITYAISGRQIFPELATKSIADHLLVGLDDFVGHFPYAFFILIALASVAQLLLGATKIGRDFYTIGGNVEAARLCGIRVGQRTMIAYAISGFCAGLAALVLVSRMTTSTENLGIGIELSAIAAAIIGGVSLQGGIGNVIGPLIGAFLMGCLLIGLNLIGVSTYAQPVLAGMILLGAVYYDRLQVLRRARRAAAMP